jgi:type VI secretion system secreted protein VgrG
MTGFNGNEGLSQLFHFQINFKAKNQTSVPFEKLLGQKIAFGVNGGENTGDPRHFQGIAVQMAQLSRSTEFTEYSLTVVPKVWLLTQTVRSRIFQHKTVPDILKLVLANQDATYEIQDDPNGAFEPREYCVQYQESDFDFISRLMEEEGIYYLFKFGEDSHTMVLGNTMQSHPDIPGDATLIFDLEAGGNRDEERIYSWKKVQDFRGGKFTLWDHHFQIPHKNLSADQTVRDSVPAGKITHKLKLAGNEDLEVYENPGRYAQRFDGIDKSGGERASDLQKIYKDNKRTVGIRMQQVEAPLVLIDAESYCRQITSGHKFNLTRHFDGDGRYVVVSATHDAREGHFRSNALGEDEYGSYTNYFICMPYAVPYRPPRHTPRPTIKGCQTAVVVGPAGEEIFTDKYGRVKVQFLWDREGKFDDDSSCWLRVVTPWAGKNWGMIHIPRIGHEVLVDFIEGDMDRPIIVGSVYNADMMPSYTLPDNKTRSGIKTRSSIGGNGFNEIRFEDKKGSEQVFVHGEKDMDIRVKNDCRDWIGNDRHLIVKRDRHQEIDYDEHLEVKRDHMEKIGRDRFVKVLGKEAVEVVGTRSLKVSDDVAEEYGGGHSEKTTGDYYVHAKNIVLEADVGLTINVGGNFVTIDKTGVYVVGSPLVNINSGGSALSGSPCSLVPPTLPQAPAVADDATFGGTKTYSAEGGAAAGGGGGGGGGGSSSSSSSSPSSNAPRHDPTSQEAKDKKHFIEIELWDDEDLPVPGEPYEITLPDGSTVASGTTDADGRARVENLDPGQCSIRFPRIDQSGLKKR